jgi:hypothetical protein
MQPALGSFHSKFQSIGIWLRLLVREPQMMDWPMKDFPHASFPPDTIKLMKDAMEAAVDTCPIQSVPGSAIDSRDHPANGQGR